MTAPTLPRAKRLRPSTLALALEPRMMFDAAAVTTAADTSAQADAQQATPNAAPTLTAEASHGTFTVGISDATTGVEVFKNSSASTVESGQTFSTLIVTVNSTNSKEALVIDGKSIALAAGNGATESHFYSYSVSTSGTQTSITIALDSTARNTAADLKALVDGIRYTALDTSVDGGTRTVTLTSLKDSGGTTDGGKDTATLAVSSDISLINTTNRAPVVSSPGVPDLAQSLTVKDLGTSKDISYSADGKHVYAASANGSISVFAVDAQGMLTVQQTLTGIANLSSLTDFAISADGKAAYAVSDSNLITFEVASDGKLTYIGSQASGNGTTVAVTVSTDSRQVYVTTQYNGVVVFNRDSGSGALTQTQVIDEGILSQRPKSVFAAGDYVFVVTDNVSTDMLVTLVRNADGTLSKLGLGSLDTGAAQFSSTTYTLAASKDGQFIYLSDQSRGIIQTYQLRNDGTEMELVRTNSISLSGVSNLSLSADGTRLYATTTNGTLGIYSVSSLGALTLNCTLKDLASAAAISVSPDGKSILVAGASLSRFSDILTYINGSEQTFASSLTLSDANLDALASGAGNYQGASLTVSRSDGANADDQFGLRTSSSLTLASGVVSKDGLAVATLSQSNGVLTIRFTAALTTAQANEILHQLTYRNTLTSADASTISLSVIANDGELSSNALTVALLLTNNTAPTLTTSVVSHTPYDTAKVQTPLFSSTSVNTGEVGQNILSMSVAVSGLANVAHEFLIVDGTRIDLSATTNGTTTNGYTYSYVLSSGVGTLSISRDGGIATTAVQTLVDGMAYSNDSTSAVNGSRTVTLATLRDSGGGSDTANLAISTTLAIAVNNAPVLQVTVDPDPTLLYVNGTLSGYTEMVTAISVSSDGKTLFITGSTGSNNTGTSYLRVYARDTASGTLTLLQSFTQGTTDNPATAAIEVEGLTATSTLTVSSDGKSVYVAGYNSTGSSALYSLTLFSRDTSTGALTYVGVVATQGQAFGGSSVTGLSAAVSEIVISADGKSLYTINGVTPQDSTTGKSEVAMFSRDATTGALTFIGSYIGGTADLGVNQPTGLVVSADGKSVYISNASSIISILSRNSVTGMLTYVGKVTQASIAADPNSAAQPSDNRYLQSLQDIVISPDDKFIYVSSNTMSTLSIFSRGADGALTYVGTVDTYNSKYTTALTLREMALSKDGSTLYISTFGGKSVLVFSRDASSGKLTFVESLGVSKSVNHLAISDDGLNIYTGVTSFFAGVDIISAKANATYSDQKPSLFASGLSMSDTDFDSSGDYKGSSLIIVRSGTASADDMFGLGSGNGLTLKDGKVLKDGTTIADFNVVGGKLTLTFTASVSKAQVNEVLHQLTYANDSTPAKVELQVTVSDGNKAETTTLVLKLNHAPVASSSAYVPATGTANSAYSTSLPANLFTDSDGDRLTWSVSGLPAGLSFDAKTLTISGTPTGLSAGNHALTITAVDEHGNSSETTITLTVVADPSQTPTLSGDSTSVDYSGKTDGYNPDTYNNTLDGAQDVITSSDGKFVYVVSIPASGTSTLSIYSRDTAGKLTRVQTLFDANRDGGIEGLQGASKVQMSADQKFLYVIGSDANSLLVFTRDASSGELTLASTLKGSGLSVDGETITQVASSGTQVFVASGNSVRVYQQDAQGVLTLAHTYTDGANGIEGLQGISQLLVSPDGKFLFIGANGDNSIATAIRINADGTLSPINSLAGTSADSLYYIKSLSISADGKTLYALNKDVASTLEVLSIGADGTLTFVSTQALASGANDVVVAANGSAVFVVGEKIEVFSRANNGNLTLLKSIGSYEKPIGQLLTNLTSITLSADGKQLYITGQVSSDSTVMTLAVNLPDAAYTEGAAAVVLLPSGVLSDPQLDAIDNYKGATLTVGRSENPQTADTYEFLAANDLTLSNGQIFKGSVAIATFVQVNGVLTVTFSADTTKADAQNVLRQISYRNSSQDPTGAGDAPTFAIRLNDGDNNIATLGVTVRLTGVNDPAIIISTALNPTFREDGEFVKLFKDTRIYTIEVNQPIWQVVITVNASGANEIIRVGTDKIVLDKATSGTAQTLSGMSYAISIDNGVTTLTLYLMQSADQAAAVIDGIAYSNTGSNLSGTRSIGLAVVEYTGSAGDGKTQLTESVTVQLAAPAEPNTAPVLGGEVAVGYTERAGAVFIAPNAVVRDGQMDAFNNGQGNYNGATLTVTLGAGSGSLDTLGFSAGNGLSLSGTALQKDGVTIGQLSVAEGVLTIRFNDDAGSMPTTADVQNALRQITYASSDHAPAANVAIGVTLADRALTSTAMNLTLTITAINDTPVLIADPQLSQGELALLQNIGSVSGLGTITRAGFSEDGRSVYVTDGSGAIALFSRSAETGQLTYVRTLAQSGTDSITQLQVSHDGTLLYVLSGNSASAIVVFTRDPATGELTARQTLASDNATNYALYDPISVEESADGKSLYVLTNDGLTILSNSNGQLSYQSQIGSDAWSAPYFFQPVAIIASGDYLFVVTNPSSDNFANTLIAFKRDANGNLSAVGHVRDTQADSAGTSIRLSDPKYLAVSADGQYLYVAGTNSVQVLRFDADTGTFQSVGTTLSGLNSISDLTLSSDGHLLFVSSADGTLSRYSTADQQLKLVDSRTGSNGGQVIVSADGGVILLGNGISALRAETLPAPVYQLEVPAKAFTTNLTLSDAELDAANNYQGASLTVARSPAASADDHFGFTDGDGITLVNGQLLKNGSAIATFVDNNGTLTLSFTAAVTSAEAKAIIKSLTYSSTATASSTVNLSLTLNDGALNSSALAMKIEVVAPVVNQAPVVGDAYVPPAAEAGKPYHVVLPANLFSDPDGDGLSWSIGNLPAGLSFDAATRTLSGTLAETGTLNLTLVAADPSGASVSRVLVLTVNEPTVVVPVVPGSSAGAVDSVRPVVATDAPTRQSISIAEPRPGLFSTVPAPLNEGFNRGLRTDVVGATPDWLGLGTLTGLPDLDALNPYGNGLSDSGNRLGHSLVRPAALDGPALSANRSNVGALISVDGAAQSTRFQLPDGLFSQRGGKLTVSLRMANGLALPGWIHFDARTGQVQMDSRQLAQVEQLKLVLIARDADGKEVWVPVDLKVQGDGSAQLAPEGEQSSQAALSEHVNASGQSGLLARSQALVRALLGAA